MVNEVIMYQSMFLLGIIAFGFFSFSFNNYETDAEDLTDETNLDQIILNLGTLILDMIDAGRHQISASNSFVISSFVSIDTQFSRANYVFDFGANSDNQAIFNGYIGDELLTSYNLGFTNSTSEIVFDGSTRLFSNRALQVINYQWDGTVERVSFSVN